jgi:RNA polymerase sigma-70 factor (ECF subfamily)
VRRPTYSNGRILIFPLPRWERAREKVRLPFNSPSYEGRGVNLDKTFLSRKFFLDKMAIIGCPYKENIRGTTLWVEMSRHVDSDNRAIYDEDLEYVVLCQNGDVEAFAVLVERHQKKMLNIAYRMTGNYDDACDVVQEAFLSTYRSLKTFRQESRFSTWLYRIVVNHTKNRLKQIKTLSHNQESFSDPAEIEDERHLCQAPSSEAPPLEQLEKREREAKVQECIISLDDEYRDVLVLRDIQGFSYEEIQDILKIPDGTLKSRLFRARNALKDCLMKLLGDL